MDFAEIICALFIAAVALVSLLANLLVLLCFVHSAEIRRQVPGVFTMNLSFCNILITVLNMPATLVGIVRDQQPFADCVCHAVSFLETFLTANAMLSMAALSIDRWIAVVFPLSYSAKMRYKDALIMVCYSWLHSFTFSLTALLLSWVDYSDAYASCTLQPRDRAGDGIRFTVFTVVFHATSFVLSLLTLCFTYLKVLRVARFHCKRIDIITMQTLFLLVDIHPSVKQRCLAEQKRRKQRATKKISIFIGSFIICFAPYVITRLAELLPFVDVNRRWGIIRKTRRGSRAKKRGRDCAGSCVWMPCPQWTDVSLRFGDSTAAHYCHVPC
uniref:G-protein coupled receptors family 1 profile domain-containing protein n=1 Tax=Scophthalmus maximus TaxID=52904 RepID=A0A8D3ABJ8_SCOMX